MWIMMEIDKGTWSVGYWDYQNQEYYFPFENMTLRDAINRVNYLNGGSTNFSE